MSVSTKRGVIEQLTIVFYKSKGYTIERESSNRERSIFLNGGTVITFVQPDEQDDDKVVVSATDSDDDVTSAVVRYSKFFPELTLPVSEETVERLYTDYQGDPEASLWEYLSRKLTNVTTREKETDDTSAIREQSSRLQEKSQIAQSRETKVTSDQDISAPKLEIADDVPKAKTSTLPEDIPKFDDEYEINTHLQETQPSRPSFAPIGDRDLHPFGQYPPLRPHLGGPEPPLSGMVPDANHPLFRGPQGSGPNRGDHPQGSRYDDPYGGDDFDIVGQGLPGGRGLGGRGPGRGGPFGGGLGGGAPFGGGSNPFGGSGGFGGGFI